jgi:uncharacterized protein
MASRYSLAATIFAAGVALATAGAPAEAASFNCARAAGCVEEVICATPQLSRLDSRMSRLYYNLQSWASRRGGHVLLNSQRAWLDNRDSCGCNANCLVGMYNSRIELFEEALER